HSGRRFAGKGAEGDAEEVLLSRQFVAVGGVIRELRRELLTDEERLSKLIGRLAQAAAPLQDNSQFRMDPLSPPMVGRPRGDLLRQLAGQRQGLAKEPLRRLQIAGIPENRAGCVQVVEPVVHLLELRFERLTQVASRAPRWRGLAFSSRLDQEG